MAQREAGLHPDCLRAWEFWQKHFTPLARDFGIWPPVREPMTDDEADQLYRMLDLIYRELLDVAEKKAKEKSRG